MRKFNRDYFIGFLVDYGPSTLLSIVWAFYIVYQQPEDPFWGSIYEELCSGIFRAKLVGNAGTSHKKTVDNKARFKQLFDKIDRLEEKLNKIEVLMKDKDKE